jgi:hypothetical protein
VTQLKPDRFVIASVLFLSCGLWLIFGYCNGTAGMRLASPLSGASLNICITTNGPGAPGGIALTAIGVLLLIWALIWSIVGQFRLDGPSSKTAKPPKAWDWKDRS